MEIIDCLESLGLDESELRQFLKDVSLITDPLGQQVISHIAGPHSPIAVNAIPPFEGAYPEETVRRLYQFERIGVAQSAFQEIEGKDVRVFSVTERGKIFAELRQKIQ